MILSGRQADRKAVIMMNMKIESYCVGPVQTNCYFAINETTKEMFIVDPGDEASMLAERIREKRYLPKAILLTHGHFDHAGAAEELAKLVSASHMDADSAGQAVPIYAYETEKETLKDPVRNVSGMIGKHEVYHADIYVKDEQVLSIAGFSIRVLHTPGHTSGGCCYYVPKEDVLFSGDTLFCQSVGRTDFPGGSMGEIVQSIRKKLMTLPEQTEVYPGHMDTTSIGQERMWNPYLT